MSYSKLRGRIVEKYGTIGSFSESIKMTRRTFENKLNGKSSFSQKDIFEIVKVLEIPNKEISSYFFAD